MEAVKGIVGDTSGSVTEDDIVTATGVLKIDNTKNTLGFVNVSTNGMYGRFTLSASGEWNYSLANDNPVVQELGERDTVVDRFFVSSSTSDFAQVEITINGKNDAASITGTTQTSFIAPAAMSTGGTLLIADIDQDERLFSVATNVSGRLGHFSLTSDGVWTYTLDQENVSAPEIVNGATYDEVFSIGSVDGTVALVKIAVSSTETAPVPADGEYIGTAADQSIDGGAGVDTFILAGLPSQYKLSGNTLTGIGGIDTVFNIELYRFGGSLGSVSHVNANDLIDPDGAGPDVSPAKHDLQGISDLYVAYFNRAPDIEGLMYWFGELRNVSSWTLPTIAQSFTDQEEYKATYPEGLSNRAFIEKIYQNLFDRDPDEAGLNYWLNDLDHGVARDVFIYTVIQGAYAPSGGAADKALLNNKHDVSLYYSEQLATSTEAFDNSIDKVLNRVTGNPQTVIQAQAVIDFVIGDQLTLTGLITNDTAVWENFWV